MTAVPPGRLLAVDAATLYFRAFHALPSSVRSPSGEPVNAVHGYLDMTAVLLQRLRPAAYAACWDEDWRPAFRVALLPSYKAHRVVAASSASGEPDREEVPDELAAQVPVLAEALELLGLRRAAAPGLEADDVCATLARRWPGPVDVVSGDRDLLQLVDDASGVRVVYTGSGVAEAPAIDQAGLAERYGVPDGRAYLEMSLLRGDPSDGLPGVPGIGAKGAASLLARHGGLDGLLDAADDPASALSPAKRRALVESRDYLTTARQVVRVVADAPLDVDRLSDLALPASPADEGAVRAFTDRWGVRGPVARLRAALAELQAPEA